MSRLSDEDHRNAKGAKAATHEAGKASLARQSGVKPPHSKGRG
jgi:hypothetical protein